MRIPKAGVYGEFLDPVEKAKAEAEVKIVAIIERSAQDSWQAAVRRLERMYRDRWERARCRG